MRYLILGSSLRGLSDVARTVIADGHEALLFDSERPGAPPDLDGHVEVLDEVWDSRNLEGVDRVVASPWFSERVPPLSDAIEQGIEVITEAGFGLERLTIPYVAVTGTNGKTTVTEAATDMLRQSGIDALAAGNVGTPLSGLAPDAADVLVLELSSYQLRFIGRLRAEAVALLNIAPDHLDWHGSLEAYAAAKASIADGRIADAPFVYNADDDRAAAIGAAAQPPIIPCTGTRVPANGNGIDGNDLVVDGHRYPVGTSDATYRFDLVVAATLASAVGATPAGIAAVAASFAPGAHRREVVGEVRGVAFINDSKATNPHAAVAAARVYDSVVLLAGGRNKGLDLRPLVDVPTVKHVLPFGESGPEIAALAGTVAYPDLRSAFDTAVAIADEGDTVLLSPGCASFDEFDSYEHRGDAFRGYVEALMGVAA